MNVLEQRETPAPHRVAVVCAPSELGDRTRELARSGVEADGLFGLADFKATADRYEVMVIFVDGFEDAAFLDRLRALAGLPAAPRLIAVTDRVPEVWQPRIAREQPHLFATYASWVRRVLDVICVREIEPSGPELPFTD